MSDVKEAIEKSNLEYYKMFVDMLERYPVEIILKVFREKIEELENGAKR